MHHPHLETSAQAATLSRSHQVPYGEGMYVPFIEGRRENASKRKHRAVIGIYRMTH